MRRRRPRRSTIPLPGERQGRRSFLKTGLAGGVLLALGGAGWLAMRRTRPSPSLPALRVFTPEQATVILAVADRLIPHRPGFPRPAEIGVPARVDDIAAMAHPATQEELRKLVGLFESALAGLVLDGAPRLFTASTPGQQDLRLRSWASSRLALRRSGFKALKRLVYAAYYAAPEIAAAVGYPGPPLAPERARPKAAEAPAPEEPPPVRRRRAPPSRTIEAEPVGPEPPLPVPGGSSGE